MATEVKFPNGKKYSVASLRFSRQSCELVELIEESEEAKAEGRPFRKNGKLMTRLYDTAVNCLIDGGNTLEQAEEAVSSITMADLDNPQILGPIIEAIGIR